MTARDDLLKSFVDAMQDAGWHMTADEDYAEAERRIDGYRAQVLAEAGAGHYLSTACQHGMHDECRVTCKYGDHEICRCTACKHEAPADAQPATDMSTEAMLRRQNERLIARWNGLGVEALAQSGVDTPGCDCGHDAMGRFWHRQDCAWRVVAQVRNAQEQR